MGVKIEGIWGRLLKDVGCETAIRDSVKGFCSLVTIDLLDFLNDRGQLLFHSVCQFGRAAKVELRGVLVMKVSLANKVILPWHPQCKVW